MNGEMPFIIPQSCAHAIVKTFFHDLGDYNCMRKRFFPNDSLRSLALGITKRYTDVSFLLKLISSVNIHRA